MKSNITHEAVISTRENDSLEMGLIAQRINNVIKQDGLGVYNQDGTFDETTPYAMSSRMNYDSSGLFIGWNGMKQVVMIDFGQVSDNNFSAILKECAFDEKTIEMYEEEKSELMSDSIAVHVDLLDGDVSWFEFIVNKSIKRESENKERYYKIHIKHADYSIRLYYVKKSDPNLELKIISTKNNDILEIRANKGISIGAVEYFMRSINDEVRKKFAYLHNNPNYPCSWKSDVSEERIESTFQTIKQREVESKNRWNSVNRERYINQIKTKTAESRTSNNPPTLSEIRKAVRNNKGYYTNQTFECKLCYNHHFGGYRFYLSNYNFLVCKYCYQNIKQINPYVKVILTNMGGKR